MDNTALQEPQKLEVKEFTDSEKLGWDQFVNDSYSGDILQFWGWGESKKEQGWKPIPISIIRGSEIILAALCLIKYFKGFGNYLYIGHGPVFKSKDDLKTALPYLISFIKSKSKELNLFVIEAEPRFGFLAPEETDQSRITENIKWMVDSEVVKIFETAGFKKTGRNMQPIYKLYYDLDLSEEHLLSMMKKSTRYNIGLAQRKGVLVEEFNADNPAIPEKLDRFYNLMLEMQKRAKGYPIRSKSTFEKLFSALAGSNNLSLFEASFNGDLIATNISQRTKYWSSSFYAGSNRLHPETKAMYLLRWKSIQRAKELGSKIYDFWGIIPNSKQHEGYSDTKLSFGGVRINNWGILAYPLNPFKYWFWNTSLKIRRLLFTPK